ncbi:hypothetical protein CSKR_108170 [Clonorchis sinensis]|uniref:Uncharacterized protein n=1 Tax=Clonorchis sinensis TaxID=79923 RepID=A0A419PYP9_CLOSI|nr:hypothetical protein CSKR_108170 [Clonorchis sinensis]
MKSIIFFDGQQQLTHSRYVRNRQKRRFMPLILENTQRVLGTTMRSKHDGRILSIITKLVRYIKGHKFMEDYGCLSNLSGGRREQLNQARGGFDRGEESTPGVQTCEVKGDLTAVSATYLLNKTTGAQHFEQRDRLPNLYTGRGENLTYARLECCPLGYSKVSNLSFRKQQRNTEGSTDWPSPRNLREHQLNITAYLQAQKLDLSISADYRDNFSIAINYEHNQSCVNQRKGKDLIFSACSYIIKEYNQTFRDGNSC